jgi:hypothetical protein
VCVRSPCRHCRTRFRPLLERSYPLAHARTRRGCRGDSRTRRAWQAWRGPRLGVAPCATRGVRVVSG